MEFGTTNKDKYRDTSPYKSGKQAETLSLILQIVECHEKVLNAIRKSVTKINEIISSQLISLQLIEI